MFVSNTNLPFVPSLPRNAPTYTGGVDRLQDTRYYKAWQQANEQALSDLDLDQFQDLRDLFAAAAIIDKNGAVFVHEAEFEAFRHFAELQELKAAFAEDKQEIQKHVSRALPTFDPNAILDHQFAGVGFSADNAADDANGHAGHSSQPDDVRVDQDDMDAVDISDEADIGKKLSSRLNLNKEDGSSFFTKALPMSKISARSRQDWYSIFLKVKTAIQKDKHIRGLSRASDMVAFLVKLPDTLNRVDTERAQAGLPLAYLSLLLSSLLEDQAIKARFDSFVEQLDFAPSPKQISLHLRQASGGDVTIAADIQNLLDIKVQVSGKGKTKADIFRFVDELSLAAEACESAYGAPPEPILLYELMLRAIKAVSPDLAYKLLQPPAVVLHDGNFTTKSFQTATEKLKQIVLADSSHPDSGCVLASPLEPKHGGGGANRHFNLMTRGGAVIKVPCTICQPPRNTHEADDCFELSKNAWRRPPKWKTSRNRPFKGGGDKRGGGGAAKKKRTFDHAGLSAEEVVAAISSAKLAKEQTKKKAKAKNDEKDD